jgi:extradiol dioxygenase family protein
MNRFHYSFFVSDIERAREFYVNRLGCAVGRETHTWIDIDFFGHELSLHRGTPHPYSLCGEVDRMKVPMPHFGIALDLKQWEAAIAQIGKAGVAFLIDPISRFEGLPGEQRTAFIADEDGNAIEIKGFRYEGQLFAA